MRSSVWIALVVSAGCSSAGATHFSPVAVAPRPPPLVTASASGTAASASTAATAPPSQASPEGPCEEGATVDVAKVEDKIEGSFSRPGVHEMIGDMSCEPDGGSEWARILARRDESGVFKIVRVEGLVPMYHQVISRCQVLPTSEGRDLPICERGYVSYGDVFSSVVVLDVTKDYEDEIIFLLTVPDTTDTACHGETHLVVGELIKVELVDVDGDGNKDVRVSLRVQGFQVPKQPPCKNFGWGGSGQPPPNIPHPPLRTVDFIARGTVLKPTPAGERVLNMLGKLMPP
jgi:hypothetical protein